MAMIIITMNPELIPAISGIYSKRVLLVCITIIIVLTVLTEFVCTSIVDIAIIIM